MPLDRSARTIRLPLALAARVRRLWHERQLPNENSIYVEIISKGVDILEKEKEECPN